MPFERKLIDSVPRYYADIRESDELLNAETAELERLYAIIDELPAQFNAGTATWGLREWERLCGIETDDTKPLNERRANVIARLRGTAPATKATLLSIMGAHTLTDRNKVIEYPSDYKVRYMTDVANPINIMSLLKDLRVYTPAHLEVELGTQTTGACYAASSCCAGARVTIYPWFPTEMDNEANASTAITTQSGVTMSVFPKEDE